MFAQTVPLNNQLSKDAILAADKIVKTYHAGAKQVHKVVKVVYFHGNDRQPLPGWEERLNRTLKEVSTYYKEEFSKYGIKSNGVPFERSGNKFVITDVKGDLPSLAYNNDSFARVEQEIGRKAAGKIDLSNDHVLVFTGFCYKREDSAYVFHSPYEGKGSSISGICEVADCELLDSKLLTDTMQRMKFSEHLVVLKECAVAEFNSWYIGGIAHEMGHMFGLRHDNGNPSELAASEISLMGQYGSRHFKGYLWDDSKSSVISAAGIIQLISHPVFTQSIKGRAESLDYRPNTLRFENNDKGVLIKTSISPKSRPYAFSTLLRSTKLSEYFNESSTQLMGPDSLVNIQFGKLPHGIYLLGIVYLYPNGATLFDSHYFIIRNGLALSFQQPAYDAVDLEEFHDRLLKEQQENAQKLKILKNIIQPAEPVDPLTTTGNQLFLSDAKWENAQVGWQKPARNYYSEESERTFFLVSQGKLYEKGLFAHAPSVYIFNLGKKWRTFSAIATLRDDFIKLGIVKFTVFGDGKLLFTSPELTTGIQIPVNINISNVNTLELKAESASDNNNHCWSVWLNPVVER